jgi:hypothetical protein
MLLLVVGLQQKRDIIRSRTPRRLNPFLLHGIRNPLGFLFQSPGDYTRSAPPI